MFIGSPIIVFITDDSAYPLVYKMPQTFCPSKTTKLYFTFIYGEEKQ